MSSTAYFGGKSRLKLRERLVKCTLVIGDTADGEKEAPAKLKYHFY